jgi:hypothetical protein
MRGKSKMLQALLPSSARAPLPCSSARRRIRLPQPSPAALKTPPVGDDDIFLLGGRSSACRTVRRVSEPVHGEARQGPVVAGSRTDHRGGGERQRNRGRPRGRPQREVDDDLLRGGSPGASSSFPFLSACSPAAASWTPVPDGLPTRPSVEVDSMGGEGGVDARWWTGPRFEEAAARS